MPNERPDAYETLGLEPDATTDEVERAYRRLIRQHHPDVGGSTEEAAIINAAYDTIRRWARSSEVVMSAHAPVPTEPCFSEEESPHERRPYLLRVIGASLVALVVMRLDFIQSKLRLMPRLLLSSSSRRGRLRREAQARLEDYWWERYSGWWDAYAPLPPKGRRGLFDYSRARLFQSLRY